jgi:hypothetical protein
MTRFEKDLFMETVASMVVNLILFISGVTLISFAFSWEVGVGIGFLFMFLKGGR